MASLVVVIDDGSDAVGNVKQVARLLCFPVVDTCKRCCILPCCILWTSKAAEKQGNVATAKNMAVNICRRLELDLDGMLEEDGSVVVPLEIFLATLATLCLLAVMALVAAVAASSRNDETRRQQLEG